MARTPVQIQDLDKAISLLSEPFVKLEKMDVPHTTGQGGRTFEVYDV